MRNLLLLLAVLSALGNKSFSQVCPTVNNNLQYNEITNLGGPADNPTLNPFTFSYIPGSGNNRLLIVVVTYETENANGPNNFATVSFGGQALSNAVNQTIAAAGTQQNRLAIYYLRESNITAAVGNTVSIDFTNPGGTSPNGSINGVAVNTIMFENVNQTTPLINIQSFTSTSIMTINVPAALPATAGNYIIAAVNMALATATVGPSTPDYTVFISKQVAGSHTHSVAYKKIEADANEMPGFTANTTTRQIIGSVEVQANAVGGSCNIILPVRLVSFKGNRNGNLIKLTWKVDSESEIASYKIQRSAEQNAGFITIGELPAHNNNLSSTYSFNDAAINFNVAYYRLQIVNMDGSGSYSNVVKIENNKYTKTTVPTFFNSYISIYKKSDTEAIATVSLTDVSGKQLLQKKLVIEKGYNSLQFATGIELAKGFYLLNIVSNNKKEVFKLIKE